MPDGAAVMPPPPTAPASTLSWTGLRAGLTAGWPMGPSGFIYGIAFGVFASATGLSLLESLLMSALVFSGTAQMAVVSVWSSLGGIPAAILIVLVANVRYVLMGASLRPWLGDLPAGQSAAPLAFLVDGAYAIGVQAYAKGERDAGHLLGPALMSFAGWVVGTGLGQASGRLAADPKTFGLDFVVVAFCVAAAIGMARVAKGWLPAVAAVGAAAACEMAGLGTWAVVAAALSAAVVGAAQHRPTGTAP